MDSAFSIIKPVHNLNTPIIVFPSGEWEATQPEGLVFVFADLLLPVPNSTSLSSAHLARICPSAISNLSDFFVPYALR